jgi:type VI secretion system protein ImpE
MTPRQLLDSGRLKDALQALTAEVRDNPTDAQRRTYLFELLSFSGDYDRAEKHLDVLAQQSQAAAMGALLYRAALHAERLRQQIFGKKEYPHTPETEGTDPRTVLVNGKPCHTFEDADPRISSRLEVFAAGSYLWIPFEHIDSIEIAPPKRLRDLLWAPAVVRTGPAFQVRELGEVLLPVLSPFSWQHADDAVRLGRATVWESGESGEAIPFGHKMFVVDDEDIPMLQLHSVQFSAAAASA